MRHAGSRCACRLPCLRTRPGWNATPGPPVLGLVAGEQPLEVRQDTLVVQGMQIGMDWHASLMEYNRGEGPAVLAGAADVTAAAVATPRASSVPASALEGQLQQLFLQADPALRKRFIGWAVPRL